MMKKKKIYIIKLCKLINNLEKIKQLNDKMKIKEKEIDSKDNNSINSDINLSADILKNMKNEIEKEFSDESEENFINNNLSDDIADKIMKLDENNQNLILKELKEKAENTGKQNFSVLLRLVKPGDRPGDGAAAPAVDVAAVLAEVRPPGAAAGQGDAPALAVDAALAVALVIRAAKCQLAVTHPRSFLRVLFIFPHGFPHPIVENSGFSTDFSTGAC